ncbi:MAG: SDR family NAD(P)-dependent oxidoreductase [Coriobacteriales bacterium]|jgi:NAD(P)-dependent dehydrogenase (short-subunit alcohol dehydrogenase family)
MAQSLFTIPNPKPFDQLLSLEGKTAIVTGGGRGLGKYVVMRFAEAGANVVFCARHADQLQVVADQFASLPGTLAPVTADVSVAEDRQRLIDTACERFGGLDILVNCAAIYPPGDSMSVDEKTWDSMHDINTKATFFMSTAAARVMIDQGRRGRIINFLSTAYMNAAPMFSAYAISKAGVWEMTRVMSKDFAQYGITVNAVTPGATLTEEKAAALASGNFAETLQNQLGVEPGEMLERLKFMGGNVTEMLKQRMPMGRMGYPEDLANAVLYLASDMASYVTGQNIVVDGAQADNSTVSIPTAPSTSASAGAGEKEAAEKEAIEHSNEPDQGLAGRYSASVDTPMGKQEVELDLSTDGTLLTGTMVFMGKKLQIENGKATTAGFSYDIHVKMMMKKMDASVHGRREGDTLTGSIDNPMGSFAFTAKRD